MFNDLNIIFHIKYGLVLFFSAVHEGLHCRTRITRNIPRYAMSFDSRLINQEKENRTLSNFILTFTQISPQRIALKLRIFAYIATRRMSVASIPTTFIWKATILKELLLNVAFKRESLLYLMDILVMLKGIHSLTITQPNAATYMSLTLCQN